MELIEINSFIPKIERAPHKVYVLELTMDELRAFKLDPCRLLKCFDDLSDVDEKTNISIEGIDGDKGGYDHSNVKVTHGVVMDFRPLMIKVVYWSKPDETPKEPPKAKAIASVFDVLPNVALKTTKK